jgi:hypothetical protein
VPKQGRLWHAATSLFGRPTLVYLLDCVALELNSFKGSAGPLESGSGGKINLADRDSLMEMDEIVDGSLWMEEAVGGDSANASLNSFRLYSGQPPALPETGKGPPALFLDAYDQERFGLNRE